VRVGEGGDRTPETERECVERAQESARLCTHTQKGRGGGEREREQSESQTEKEYMEKGREYTRHSSFLLVPSGKHTHTQEIVATSLHQLSASPNTHTYIYKYAYKPTYTHTYICTSTPRTSKSPPPAPSPIPRIAARAEDIATVPAAASHDVTADVTIRPPPSAQDPLLAKKEESYKTEQTYDTITPTHKHAHPHVCTHTQNLSHINTHTNTHGNTLTYLETGVNRGIRTHRHATKHNLLEESSHRVDISTKETAFTFHNPFFIIAST